MQIGEMKILMGSANVPLAKAVCEFVGTEPTHVTLKRFPDKEVFVVGIALAVCPNPDIVNDGPGTCAAYTVDFYASTDEMIDAGDELIGTYSDVNITSGETDSGATTVTLPGTLTPGVYYVGVIVTNNDSAPANNDTDGFDAFPVYVLGCSTPGVPAIPSISPNPACSGSDVLISWPSLPYS